MEHQQSAGLWTVDDLAGFLRKHKTSIYSDLKRNPGAIPPPLRLPGSGKLLWDPVFVMEWVRGFQTGAGAPTKPPQLAPAPVRRGPGRPRKLEVAGGTA